MATNTAGNTALRHELSVVHTKAVPIVYTTAGVYTICKVPAGAAIIDAGVVVTTAFAGGTPQTLNIGVTGNADDFGSALVLTTVGVIKADDMATATSAYCPAAIDVIATLAAGATPSAGAGYAYVTYILANRGA